MGWIARRPFPCVLSSRGDCRPPAMDAPHRATSRALGASVPAGARARCAPESTSPSVVASSCEAASPFRGSSPPSASRQVGFGDGPSSYRPTQESLRTPPRPGKHVTTCPQPGFGQIRLFVWYVTETIANRRRVFHSRPQRVDDRLWTECRRGLVTPDLANARPMRLSEIQSRQPASDAPERDRTRQVPIPRRPARADAPDPRPKRPGGAPLIAACELSTVDGRLATFPPCPSRSTRSSPAPRK